MSPAEKDAALAVLEATRDTLKRAVERLNYVIPPHQVHAATLEGDAYFPIVLAAELYEGAAELDRVMAHHIDYIES